MFVNQTRIIADQKGFSADPHNTRSPTHEQSGLAIYLVVGADDRAEVKAYEIYADKEEIDLSLCGPLEGLTLSTLLADVLASLTKSPWVDVADWTISLSHDGACTFTGGTTNSAATGAPSVSGTVRVGETLTAVTSGVADADGLGVFSYQWSADSSPISGATASTYTLVAADLGKAISVAVSFTDGGGNAESVASSPTAAVAAAEDSDDDDSDSGTATPAPTPHPVCGVAPSNGVIQGYPSYNRLRCGPTQWKEAADSSECTAVGRWKIADGEMLYICVRGWYARWMASNR